MSAPVCSRRVSAGITPAPGTTSRLPVWWGRVDWIEVEVRGALAEHREVCREHHVSPDTVLAVARAHAAYADALTGRDCRPTNERLVEDARCSLSTVQRARRVLKALGLMVEVTAGRSVMTVAERLAAWERGSSHRAIAAEFVLCSRRDRRPRLVENPGPDLQVVDRDTPPVGQVVRKEVTSRRTPLRSETERGGTASRPAHTQKGSPRRGPAADLATRRLARDARTRLVWLRSEPTGRMTPLLQPFAQADWTGDDIARAVADVIAAHGWRGVPSDLKRPAAYLAMLLREVDPADRPGALDEWRAEVERKERIYRRQLRDGAPCPHGQPAGDIPSPVSGVLACPLCRAGG